MDRLLMADAQIADAQIADAMLRSQERVAYAREHKRNVRRADMLRYLQFIQ